MDFLESLALFLFFFLVTDDAADFLSLVFNLSFDEILVGFDFFKLNLYNTIGIFGHFCI